MSAAKAKDSQDAPKYRRHLYNISRRFGAIVKYRTNTPNIAPFTSAKDTAISRHDVVLIANIYRQPISANISRHFGPNISRTVIIAQIAIIVQYCQELPRQYCAEDKANIAKILPR
jgi:hypothetical protein